MPMRDQQKRVSVMRSNPFSEIAATLLGGDLEACKKEARPREGRKACKILLQKGGKTKNARLTTQIGTGQLDKKRQAESRKIKDGLKVCHIVYSSSPLRNGKSKKVFEKICKIY
jgi:hypothetical protein